MMRLESSICSLWIYPRVRYSGMNATIYLRYGERVGTTCYAPSSTPSTLLVVVFVFGNAMAFIVAQPEDRQSLI